MTDQAFLSLFVAFIVGIWCGRGFTSINRRLIAVIFVMFLCYYLVAGVVMLI